MQTSKFARAYNMCKRNFFVGKLFKDCTASPYEVSASRRAKEERMTGKSQHQTAQIIPFPARARTGALGRQASGRKSAELPTRAVAVEAGSGWYHDAAIQDAEQVRHHS